MRAEELASATSVDIVVLLVLSHSWATFSRLGTGTVGGQRDWVVIPEALQTGSPERGVTTALKGGSEVPGVASVFSLN